MPLAAETSGAHNADATSSGSPPVVKLVELDSFEAPAVPGPGQSTRPQAGRSVVSVVPAWTCCSTTSRTWTRQRKDTEGETVGEEHL